MIVLRVFPEFGCWPVWEVSEDDVSININPSDLPIPERLATELIEWNEQYQATLNDEYPPWSGFRDAVAAVTWCDYGQGLALQLAAALDSSRYRVVSEIGLVRPEDLVAVREE